jgi:hypothetical protein
LTALPAAASEWLPIIFGFAVILMRLERPGRRR